MDAKETLTIQTDVIEKQQEVTTSLCDRFGINMYSQEFLNQEKIYNEQLQQSQNEMLQQVMTNTKADTSEAAFQTVLHAETQEVLKKDYTDNQKDSSAAMSYLFLLLGVVLAGVVLFYIEQKRRSKKKRENYSDNYQL